MYKFYSIVFLPLILLVFSFCFAGTLGMCVDYGDFYFDDTRSSLEIYFRIDRSKFKLLLDSVSNEFVGKMGLKIEIEEKSGKKVDSLSYTTSFRVRRNEPLSQKYYLFDVYPFELTPGEYNVFIRSTDLHSDVSDSIILPVYIRDFHNKPSASAIMLAISSDTSSIQSPFIHAGRKMLPAPDGLFDLNTPNLFYYLEFYLPHDETKPYIIRTTITSSNGASKSFESQRVMLGYASAYINGFSISSLADGKYELTVSLLDTMNYIVATASKLIEIRKYPAKIESEEKTSDIEMIKGILTYLLAPDQLRIFNELDDNAKKLFWERFWMKNDTSVGTTENEIRDEYVNRWHYVNAMFSDGNDTPGWRTDKGRIYLIYGPPDNIERHGLESGCDPYERWDYFSLRGGTFFIFSDRMGRSKLVHSNAQGEISDQYWRDRITTPGSPSYFENIQTR